MRGVPPSERPAAARHAAAAERSDDLLGGRERHDRHRVLGRTHRALRRGLAPRRLGCAGPEAPSLGRGDPVRAARRTLRRGPRRGRRAPRLARRGGRARLRDPDRRSDRAGYRDARRRALRLRARDELRAAVRRPHRRRPEQPGVHRARARRAHRQSVSRPDADAAAAPLSRVERGRRREHAGRRLPRGRGPLAGPPRPARAVPAPLPLCRRRHRARDGGPRPHARCVRRACGGPLQHALGAADPRSRRPRVLRGVPGVRPDARGAALPDPVQARGRTGYSESGERHLQGCYADRDGLRSKLAVLSR